MTATLLPSPASSPDEAELLAAAQDACHWATTDTDAAEALAAWRAARQNLGDRSLAVATLAVSLVLDPTLQLARRHRHPHTRGEATNRALVLQQMQLPASRWAWQPGEASAAAGVAIGFAGRWGRRLSPRAMLFQALLREEAKRAEREAER